MNLIRQNTDFVLTVSGYNYIPTYFFNIPRIVKSSQISTRCGRVVTEFDCEAKTRRNFHFNKQDDSDFMKFSKMTMCRASEANS